jgi:hypothetical protein
MVLLLCVALLPTAQPAAVDASVSSSEPAYPHAPDEQQPRINLPPDAVTGIPWHNKGAPFGIVASLGNRVRQDEIDAAVALMREAGVQWQREEIFWDRVQKAPGGPFIWTGDGTGMYNYDYAISAQAAAGINILGLLDYNPYWFKGQNPAPEEWIDDWGAYVYATVARYGRDMGWIKHWELWNEPNLAGSGYESGLYQVSDFVRILEVGNAAAKAADPEAQIVMAGMASIWGVPPSEYNYDYFDYLERVGQLGGWNHVDIIAIHPYRPNAPEGSLHGRGEPLDFRNEFRRLDRMLLTYGVKPVWITELGWPTSSIWPGIDEDAQAFFLVRSYVLAMTHPTIEKYFWYDFRNDTDPNAPYEQPAYNDTEAEYHFGLLRREFPLDPNSPTLRKPSFLAYRTMTEMLGGLWLQEMVIDGDEPDELIINVNAPEIPGIYWYRFGNGERVVDVLWRTTETWPEMTVECGCREALVRNWNGEVKHLLYTNDGTLSLNLEKSAVPMYVEYDPPVNQDGEFFTATGHTLRGAFRAYWHAYGGVERFGYPLTEEIIEPEPGTGRPRVVQYFDRARFEHYPEYSGSDSEVRLSRIGEQMLFRQGIQWHTLPKLSGAPEACLFFETTGHSLCPPFRQTWENYENLRSLGYPITQPMQIPDAETGEQRTVQYFEYARLDHFPEHSGTPAEVQLGLLGREYLVRWGGIPR